jgi:electron-transferring-flavoprotein dehydrogenase
VGTLMNGFEQYVLRGHAPWTLHRPEPDHVQLRAAAECPPIDYPKPDGQLTFDRLSSVFISNTNHEENQPAHLTLKDAERAGQRSTWPGSPAPRVATARPGCTNLCPTRPAATQRLQINAQNCVHCKTCDIKDPTQNIVWVTPEGGGGPNYSGM